MSEIKTLEELRHHAHVLKGGSTDYNELFEIADRIKAEIAERFVELPVDADGVPIRAGDTIYNRQNQDSMTVYEIGFTDNDGTRIYNADGKWALIDVCTHVKPRTLESILCDALADVSCMGDGIVRTFKPDEPYVAELAAEIRELLGVSE